MFIKWNAARLPAAVECVLFTEDIVFCVFCFISLKFTLYFCCFFLSLHGRSYCILETEYLLYILIVHSVFIIIATLIWPVRKVSNLLCVQILSLFTL